MIQTYPIHYAKSSITIPNSTKTFPNSDRRDIAFISHQFLNN